MREQLQAKPILQSSFSPKNVYILLYIFLLTICNAAHSQPTMVSNLPDGSRNFVTVNGRLYFSSGDSLFTATSSSPATFVKKVNEPIVAIYNLQVGSSFFFLTQSASGQRLWRSGGSNATTSEVALFSQITPLLVYNGSLYMRVNASGFGIELWKIDATYNTSLVKDINPGEASGFIGSLIIHNNLLYFMAQNTTGPDIWKSDGTSINTVRAVNLDDEEMYLSSGWYGLTSVGSSIFFTRNYESSEYGDKIAELWKTNGTDAGTVIVKQFQATYSYNFLSNLIAFEGKLYFFHNEEDPIYTYFSVSDGTAAGTVHLDLLTIDGGARKLITAGDYMLYYGDSQSFTTPIEKSDGAASSTVHVFSEYHSESDFGIDLTYADGRAFFLDDEGDYYGNGVSLWQADLNNGIARPVKEIHGVPTDNASNITESNGAVFFTRNLSGQVTLWYYDPGAPPSPCAGNGSIEREEWSNITGYGVGTIPTGNDPTSITTLTSFEAPRNKADNYGARIRGYVCVPQNGNYVFYISSDDNSELWLSTDDNPANKRLIASSKWTNYNQWDKYTTQQSAEIPLVTGKRYYIEALHKEAAGADHLSVGWKLPNGTFERPMPGVRLIPYQRTTMPRIQMTSPAEGATYVAPADIPITATASDTDGHINRVSFYANGAYLGEVYREPYTFTWQNAPAGTHTIVVKAHDNDGNTVTASRTVTVTPASCTATGRIYQEMWSNVTGNDVRTFDFSQTPNGGGRWFTSFETSQYYANNYASRMKGYVCVPQTGNYTFWISSDDYSELYVSTDETPQNRRMVAYVYGATSFRNYDKYPSQKSVPITLQAGYKYYIEVRHKEGTGNDFISVGWQLPNGTMERPIPGNRLVEIAPIPNNPPSISIVSPQPNQDFPYPNTVRFTADVTDPDGVKLVTFDLLKGSSSERIASFTGPPYDMARGNLAPGAYQLIVSATDNLNSGSSKILFFTVQNTPCGASGSLVREIWTGIPGTSVSSIPVDTPPDATQTLTNFATQNYFGNDYGSRIRGYVCAPQSGVYTFWISGDDNSELWLSDNDDPATKKKIAYVTGATSVNQWTKYPSQMSTASINLVQGQRYYIEVLHKEASGADHVEVGWQLPNGTLERPIGGSRLIPFEDASTSAAQFATEEIFTGNEQGQRISVYPNPVTSGSRLTIALPDGVGGDMDVDIMSATGISVQNQKLTSAAGELSIDLKPSISSGIYLIKVSNHQGQWLNKVQVK